MPAIRSDRRLYVSRDGQRVVEHGDPAAAFLLAGVGGKIGADKVELYGLRLEGGRVVVPGVEPAPEPVPEPEPEAPKPAPERVRARKRKR